MLDLNFIIFLLFFFFCYCGKIPNKEQYLNNSIETTPTFDESIYLEVSFERRTTKPYNYLNIQIEKTNEDTSGFLSFYSKYDKDCMPDRTQMNINPYGNSFMAINKEFLIYYYGEDDERYDDLTESFYLCVYCINELNCNYSITFEFNNTTYIPNNINFFNYYSYENNQTFNFSFEYNQKNNINENNIVYELYWIKRNNTNKFINFDYSLPEKYNGILLKPIPYENGFINCFIKKYYK